MLRPAASTMDDVSLASQPPQQSVAISEDARLLIVALAGGRAVALNAERLRAACRCAHCRRAHYDGTFPQSFEGVAIERFELIGHYGVNVAFSDGHARGIFPWSYLATLSTDDPAVR